VNPCSGVTGSVTFDFQGVSHITALDNGTFHDISTVTGTFTFVPDDPEQPTYSGQFTETTGGDNHNSKSFTTSFHINAVLKGSDGSLLAEHVLFHVTMNANGTVTASIDTETITCR
jgi:hypothetical protein